MINPDTVSDLIRECVDAHILPRYQALGDDDVSTKTGPADLVTQADIDAEKHLERVLPDLLPGSIVMGEEGVSRGDVSIDVLKDISRPVWVVDPVDGTYNFVHGRPGFGTMVSLVVAGEIVGGWIYEILGDRMLVAERGAGARLNDTVLCVSDDVLDFSAMRGHMSLKFFPEPYRSVLKEKSAAFQSVDPICCASEYLNLATGAAQFSLYSRLKPWDHFAGVLIVQEAGGVVAKWNGEAFTSQDYGIGLLSANSQAHWDAVRGFLVDDDWMRFG